jgi:hypothetical protein
MNLAKLLSLWGPFILVSVASRIAGEILLGRGGKILFFGVTSLFAIASIALGSRVLWKGIRNIWTVLLVLGVLFEGQLQLLLISWMFLAWSIGGFAP